MRLRLNLPVNTPSAAQLSFPFPQPPPNRSVSLFDTCHLVGTTYDACIYRPNQRTASLKYPKPCHTPSLQGPCHLLGSQKGQLLPQGGDVVVASLLDSCAARDSLGAQILHHDELRQGLVTWQPGPRGLTRRWMRCLCRHPSCRWQAPTHTLPMPYCRRQNAGRWRAQCGKTWSSVLAVSSAFHPSHSSMQSPLPSIHIWQCSGHLVSLCSSSVLR